MFVTWAKGFGSKLSDTTFKVVAVVILVEVAVVVVAAAVRGSINRSRSCINNSRSSGSSKISNGSYMERSSSGSCRGMGLSSFFVTYNEDNLMLVSMLLFLMMMMGL